MTFTKMGYPLLILILLLHLPSMARALQTGLKQVFLHLASTQSLPWAGLFFRRPTDC